jgi:hypothetical protein
MGNDLHLVDMEKGESISNLGRKHNYMIDCMGGSLPSREEVEQELQEARIELCKMMVSISVLSFTEYDEARELTDRIQYTIEKYEDLNNLAGKIAVLDQITDEFNDNSIGVLDDFELEKLQTENKKEPISEHKSTIIKEALDEFKQYIMDKYGEPLSVSEAKMIKGEIDRFTKGYKGM